MKPTASCNAVGVTLKGVLFAVVVITVFIVMLLNSFPARRNKGNIFDTNSLALTPITNTKEPFVLTYTIPLNIDLKSNKWAALKLMDNGKGAKGYDFIRQTNGTYLVEWNTTFESPGSNVLQVELYMGFRKAFLGPKRTENVTNLAQFDPADTSFGGQACIRGILHVSLADYKIEIYDETNNLIKTITGHTDEGMIYKVWDLKSADGRIRDDPQFEAKIYITPTPGATSRLDTSNTASVSIPYPYHLCRTGKAGVGFRQ
jgi:hypothetical protein